MFPPSSKLSRVCGHGHIKKFWLMQTQIETKHCDNDANAESASWISGDLNMEGQDMSCSSASASEEGPYTGADLSTYGHDHGDDEFGAEKVADAAHMLGSGDIPEAEEEEDANEEEEELGTAQKKVVRHNDTHSSAESELKSKNSEADVGDEELKESRINEHMVGEDVQVSDVRFRCLRRAQHDSLMDSSERRNDTCSSPTSIMEPVCGDDADNSSDEKVSSIHGRVDDCFDERNAAEQRRMVEAPNGDNFAALKSCTMCGTTKTPMWRTGPQGPKSLCNACGIRFKKYRSYPGQTDISESMVRPLKRKTGSEYLRSVRSHEGAFPKFSSNGEKQQKKSNKWHQLVLRRDGDGTKRDERSEDSGAWKMHMGSSPLKKIYDYPFQSSLKKLAPLDQRQTLQRVFPDDEEEAAVLLMHLSCGLVY